MSSEYEQHLRNVAAEMNAEADRQEIAEKALSKAMKAGKSSKKLIPKYVLSKDSPNPPEIYSVRYSPDSELLAATHADGFLRVYHGATGKERYVMQCGGHDHMPVLCCRWRPSMGNKTKNVLLVGTGEGHIQHWHVTSSKLLSDSWLEDETIYACDYTYDGNTFAVGGKKQEVLVYDESTREVKTTMSRGDETTCSGHSNRIFCLKFHPEDTNLLVTGGWDNTVQMWDLRLKRAVKSLTHVEVRGDAVDISSDGKYLLTGAHRSRNPLQIWELGTMRLESSVPWRTREGELCLDRAPSLFCAQFSKDGQSHLIAAGGGHAGRNEAALFDRRCSNVALGLITGMGRACFGVDFSPDCNSVAVAGADSIIRVMDMDGV